MSTWMIFPLLIVCVGLWYWFMKTSLSPREAYLKKYGLPKDWTPPKYMGPLTEPGVYKLTPKGIKYFPRGFDKNYVAEFKEGVRARVIPGRIDEIWREVRDRMMSDSEKRLNKHEKGLVAKLKDDLPIVIIQDSLWWDDGNVSYLSGVTLVDRAYVVVWYKTVVDPIEIKNWERVLDWEFQNVIFIKIGLPERAS